MAYCTIFTSILIGASAILYYYLFSIITSLRPTPKLIPSSIELLSATTTDLLTLLENRTVTSVQLVQEYQRRIARDNRRGLWLNAILSTAPEENVLQIAQERDEQRARGELLGPLHGIPFVVKVSQFERTV